MDIDVGGEGVNAGVGADVGTVAIGVGDVVMRGGEVCTGGVDDTVY